MERSGKLHWFGCAAAQPRCRPGETGARTEVEEIREKKRVIPAFFHPSSFSQIFVSSPDAIGSLFHMMSANFACTSPNSISMIFSAPFWSILNRLVIVYLK